MMASCKSFLAASLPSPWYAIRTACYTVFFMLSLPFLGGLYYAFSGNHLDEQYFLDRCVDHLKQCRAVCSDPDLCEVLDYTVQRYNKVGAWNVMFAPLSFPYVAPGMKVVGCNCPWCPGVTLDTCTLLWTPEEAAMVLAHEAMHDHYPYFGHSYVTPREIKIQALSYKVQFAQFERERKAGGGNGPR